MATRGVIDEFLAQRHIAFVGASRNSGEFANAVYRRLREGNRTMYPVNRAEDAGTIEGDQSYRSLADVPDPVDGVVVMVPPSAEAEVVADAVRRGVPRVWVHRGIGGKPVSEEVRRTCRDAGVALVDGACPLMFDAPVRGIHRVHQVLSRRRFAA